MEWIRSEEGGYVNSTIQIRCVIAGIENATAEDEPNDVTDSGYNYGLFSKGTIREKERLFTIPQSVLITSSQDQDPENTNMDPLRC